MTKKRGSAVRIECKPHELVVAGSNLAPASNDRGIILLIHFCIIKQRIDRIYRKLQKSKLSYEDKIWVLIVTTEPLPQISRKTEGK